MKVTQVRSLRGHWAKVLKTLGPDSGPKNGANNGFGRKNGRAIAAPFSLLVCLPKLTDLREIITGKRHSNALFWQLRSLRRDDRKRLPRRRRSIKLPPAPIPHWHRDAAAYPRRGAWRARALRWCRHRSPPAPAKIHAPQ